MHWKHIYVAIVITNVISTARVWYTCAPKASLLSLDRTQGPYTRNRIVRGSIAKVFNMRTNATMQNTWHLELRSQDLRFQKNTHQQYVTLAKSVIDSLNCNTTFTISSSPYIFISGARFNIFWANTWERLSPHTKLVSELRTGMRKSIFRHGLTEKIA